MPPALRPFLDLFDNSFQRPDFVCLVRVREPVEIEPQPLRAMIPNAGSVQTTRRECRNDGKCQSYETSRPACRLRIRCSWGLHPIPPGPKSGRVCFEHLKSADNKL